MKKIMCIAYYHFKFDSKVTPYLLNQVLEIIKVGQRVLTKTIKEYEKYCNYPGTI